MNETIARNIRKRASVLMEFVIVAPLYLILIGGAAAVFDLSIGRCRLHMADRYFTWMYASRWCPSDKLVDDAFLNGVYGRTFSPAPEAMHYEVVESRPDGVAWQNAFAFLAAGGQRDYTIKLPSWIRTMMALQDSSSMPADGEVKFSCDYNRVFCLHRTPANMRGDEISAHALVVRGMAGNIANDFWIALGGDVNDSRGTWNIEEEATGEVERCLGYFGE